MLSKSAVKAAKAYEKSVLDRDVARARVTGGSVVPGPYLAIPLIGWMVQIGGGRFLSLGMSLIRISDNTPAGSLGWALPFGPRTEDQVANVLACLGWDGRIWPMDEGWPGGTTFESTFRAMLEQSDLTNAMTFPPVEEGGRAVKVQVLSATTPFALDPACVGAVEVPEGWKSRLWALVSNPSWFR